LLSWPDVGGPGFEGIGNAADADWLPAGLVDGLLEGRVLGRLVGLPSGLILFPLVS
jgi:hypothetical protein